jgi:hypothetical protein
MWPPAKADVADISPSKPPNRIPVVRIDCLLAAIVTARQFTKVAPQDGMYSPEVEWQASNDVFGITLSG